MMQGAFFMQFFKKVKGVLQMAHNGIVYDSDPHFKINVDTRQITNESTKKTSLIQFDHKSERFSFEMDRFVEGHDMTECNRVEVHFTNTGTKADEVSEDVYDVVDVHTDTDDENKIVFSWLLSSNATKYEGKLKFLIRFACTSDDGTVEYAWHTAKFNNITISKGLNNGKSVVDTYSDILAQWKEELKSISYDDLKDKPTIVGDLSGSVDDNAIPTGRAVQRCVGNSASEVVTFLEAQIKSLESKLLNNQPITVLKYYPYDIDDMLYGCYVYNSQYNYEPSIMVIAGCYNEDINETPDGEWAKTYTYRQHIIDSRRGFVVREKAICDNYADWNYDWREVPLNDSTATKEYVDNSIGDIETTLENIIKKYGLGGESK